MFGETVTVYRYELDRYGDTVLVTSFPLKNCAVAPGTGYGTGETSEEVNDRSTTVTENSYLYVRRQVDLTPSDVVERADGTRWQVYGAAGQWDNPHNAIAGTVAQLRRVTG